MIKEKSVGAVVFAVKESKAFFLLLHYKAGHWGFAKGHAEGSETEQQTLLREIEEETGLVDVRLVPGFSENTHYFFQRGRDRVSKEVAFYLVEAKEFEVEISHEHQGFEWLPFDAAEKRLSFKNTKEILGKATEFIKQLH